MYRICFSKPSREAGELDPCRPRPPPGSCRAIHLVLSREARDDVISQSGKPIVHLPSRYNDSLPLPLRRRSLMNMTLFSNDHEAHTASVPAISPRSSRCVIYCSPSLSMSPLLFCLWHLRGGWLGSHSSPVEYDGSAYEYQQRY